MQQLQNSSLATRSVLVRATVVIGEEIERALGNN